MTKIQEMKNVQTSIQAILQQYHDSFNRKEFDIVASDPDILMRAFGISTDLVEQNKQYWNRELGKCWERVVSKIFELTKPKDFKPAYKIGADEPIDFIYKDLAIDTKYRVGSGDSGTLKKFKQYGETIRGMRLTPTFLFLRTDNLPAAMTACRNGGWEIYQGQETLRFIKEETNFDLHAYLIDTADSRRLLIRFEE